jgi:predicted nucleotidyltransferase
MHDMRDNPLLAEPVLAKVQAICAAYGVRQLDLFGSVLTRHFDPDRSDVDLLVTFANIPEGSWFGAYFELKEALEAAFNRPVDLVIDRDFPNPHFRKSVASTRQRLFPG